MSEIDKQAIAALSGCISLIDDMSRFVGQMRLKDYGLFNSAPLDAQRVITALQDRKLVHFDPMKNGGCPQCKWETGNLGTILIENCELHQKIEDLMADGGTDKTVLADFYRQDDKLREITGCAPEDDLVAAIRDTYEAVEEQEKEKTS